MRALIAIWLGLLLLGGCVTAPQSPVAAPVQHVAEAPYLVQPERMAAKRVFAHASPVDLVFIGDSITQNYEKHSANPAENYAPIWDRFYGQRRALNLGYGMDTTGATLWRFDQGELDGIAPKVAVVLIGTNDTNLGRGVSETFAGVEAVVEAVHARLPRTRILLLGILPSAKSAAKSAADAEINAHLATRYVAGSFVTFLDVAPIFIKEGALDASLFVEQGSQGPLHPNAKGQAAMAKAIEPVLARLLGELP